MKKILSIIAVIAFVGMLSAPLYAMDETKPAIEKVADDDTKKETTKETAKKAEAKTADCAAKAEAKSGCETKTKSCGDKDKK